MTQRTMRAYVVEYPNGPFQLRELPIPVPNQGQVVVRVKASGVNPLDTKIRAGKAAHAKQPLPATLGLDMAGTIEAIGPGPTRLRLGDEVYGMVGGVGGLPGTLAEFVVVDADLLAIKPKSLSMRQAAALPLVTITAWEGLVDRARVREGQLVLVHAGAGGVGHVAVQLAKAFGAKVFATVSSEKESIVSGFDAQSIDYKSTPVNEYVQHHTQGTGFDIVYDTVGGATIDESFEAVKKYTGHVISCLGWSTHSLAPLSFRGATYSGVFTLLPLLTGTDRRHHGHILQEAASLADQGKLVPLLHQRQFGWDEFDDAYAAVQAGELGKVVIDVAC